MGKVKQENKEENILQQVIKDIKHKTIKKNLKKSFIKLPVEDDEVTEKKISKEDEEKGIMYLGHIPHGFFEKEIKSFFRQFGRVQKVRLARSKRTGKSKGYAFILFENVAVAKVAADAMNNYLMCGRLLQASYVPKNKQNMEVFFGNNYHSKSYPRLHNVKKLLKNNHKKKTIEEINKRNMKSTKKLAAIQQKLLDMGLNLTLKVVKKGNFVVNKERILK